MYVGGEYIFIIIDQVAMVIKYKLCTYMCDYNYVCMHVHVCMYMYAECICVPHLGPCGEH